MAQYDQATEEQFDPATITIARKDDSASDFTDDQLKRLCGAPADSNIHVGALDSIGIYLLATGPSLDGPMIRLIGVDENGESFMRNELFRLEAEKQGEGRAGRALAIQAHQAAKLGFKKLTALAAGNYETLNDPSQKWSGYMVWLRLGYDGEIPWSALADRVGGWSAVPPNLREMERLSQLMATDEGKAFWLEYGSSVEVEFDLTEDSNSWNMLRQHMHRRGIKIDL